MARPFLDSSVLLRHLLQDDADESPRATAYLSCIEADEVRVRTAITVVFEAVLALEYVHSCNPAYDAIASVQRIRL